MTTTVTTTTTTTTTTQPPWTDPQAASLLAHYGASTNTSGWADDINGYTAVTNGVDRGYPYLMITNNVGGHTNYYMRFGNSPTYDCEFKLPSNVNLDIAGTVAMWMRPLDVGSLRGLWSEWNNDGYHQVDLRMDTSSRVYTTGYDQNDYQWSGGYAFGFTNGGWYHVALTWSNNATGGAGAVLYINGTQVWHDATVNMSANAYNQLWLGAYNGGNNSFYGWLGDVRLYTKAIASNEVLDVYQHSWETIP